MLTSCDDQRPQRAGFIMLVYGTYKVQNGSLNDALYGGPSTQDNDGYPGSVSGESNSYYGYSRSAIEVNANTYINSAGQSGTGFLNYVDCGEVKDHLFENDTLSESSAPTAFQAFAAGYATEDYRDLYLQRNCYVGKSGLVALGTLTGLVGLFLIPASLCSAFCVSRRCNRTLNMWVAAMLTAAALALSIVCIWAITLYGATNQVLNQALSPLSSLSFLRVAGRACSHPKLLREVRQFSRADNLLDCLRGVLPCSPPGNHPLILPRNRW